MLFRSTGLFGLMKTEFGTPNYRPPHRCRGRQVLQGQFIHSSVIDHMRKNIDGATEPRVFEARVFGNQRSPASNLSHGKVGRVFPFLKRPSPSPSKEYVPHARIMNNNILWKDLKNHARRYSYMIVDDLYSSATRLLTHLGNWATRQEGKDNRVLTRRAIDPLLSLAASGETFRGRSHIFDLQRN